MKRVMNPVRVFLKLTNFSLYRNNEIRRKNHVNSQLRPSIVLFDRACPLCRGEMHRLKKRDRDGRLALIDITAADFNEKAWGVSREAASEALHVLTPEKVWLVGMDAIRHVYTQVGLGWLMAPSGWPVMRSLSDIAYRWIAPNRFVISRWMGLEQEAECTDAKCDERNEPSGGAA